MSAEPLLQCRCIQPNISPGVACSPHPASLSPHVGNCSSVGEAESKLGRTGETVKLVAAYPSLASIASMYDAYYHFGPADTPVLECSLGADGRLI